MVTLAMALVLVTGGTVAALTGHVIVSGAVVNDTGTTVYETAAPQYTFLNRSYQNLPLNTPMSLVLFDSDSGSAHTFTILNRSDYEIPNPSTFSSSALGALMKKWGTLGNVTAGRNGGKNTTVIAAVASPSWYEFVCLEPGHFQAGMYGFIAFGMALPTNLTFGSGAPGPGIAVFIIIGTIVALTVLAIVLGFVVGQRHGSEHEMPPERLGYPEPSAPPPSDSPPLPPDGSR